MVPVSSLAIWLDRVVLETEAYTETVAPLPSEPGVSRALSAFIVDEVLRETDARPGLEDFLRERLGRVAGRAAGAALPSLEEQVADIVDRSLQSETFGGLWEDANRQMHPVALAAVTGDDNPALERRGGRVELSLKPAIDAVAADLSDELNFAIPVPEEIGRVELFQESDVRRGQIAARLLRAGSWILPVVNATLLLLGLILARRRRSAVVMLGVGVVVTSVASLVALRETKNAVVGNVRNEVFSDAAAGAAWDTLTRGLANQVWILVAVGLGLTVAAILAGRLMRSGE